MARQPLTNDEKLSLSQMSTSEGYAILKRHFEDKINQKFNNFDKRTFKDLSDINELQAEIRTIRGVFDFVEGKTKGDF